LQLHLLPPAAPEAERAFAKTASSELQNPHEGLMHRLSAGLFAASRWMTSFV
jgi:hypothetical protein